MVAGAVTAVAGSSVGKEGLKQAGEVQKKIIDNEARRYEARERIKRTEIDADVEKTIVQQKEYSKRYATTADHTQTWRNTSDEILNALDRPFIEINYKRKKKTINIKLSVMNLIGLAPLIKYLGIKNTDTTLGYMGDMYMLQLNKIIPQIGSLTRQVGQGGLTFTPAYTESGVAPGNGTVPDTEEEYEQELAEGVYAKVIGMLGGGGVP